MRWSWPQHLADYSRDLARSRPAPLRFPRKCSRQKSCAVSLRRNVTSIADVSLIRSDLSGGPADGTLRHPCKEEDERSTARRRRFSRRLPPHQGRVNLCYGILITGSGFDPLAGTGHSGRRPGSLSRAQRGAAALRPPRGFDTFPFLLRRRVAPPECTLLGAVSFAFWGGDSPPFGKRIFRPIISFSSLDG
jgi:hypothetical protein